MICQREDELLDALGRGYIGAELDAHVTTCDACTELREVAGALLEDRAHAVAEATIPSAGTMWWRLQMRHRQEAQTIARRSLFVGQAATLAVALTLVIAIFGSQFAGEVRTVFSSLTAFRISGPVLLMLTTWALLAPIGGYIATRQK
ncbi:MAG TPA: hypothetical protein VF787_12210 [Thermoanaerobaculia bacterium]